MKKIFVLILFISFIAGCSNQAEDNDSYFMEPSVNLTDNKIHAIKLDTVHIKLPNTSYNGFSCLFSDKIYFADKFLCWVYELNSELETVARHLGQGRGPGEIPIKNIAGYTVSEKGSHIFVGTTRDMYVYDTDFKQYNKVTFLPRQDSQTDTDPFQRYDFYSLDYENPIIRTYKKSVFFNVIGGNDEYNISTKPYYKKARILMEVDSENGNIERVSGRLSPKVQYMTAFSKCRYDIDNRNGDFYVTYEPDSLIYVYDKEYHLKYSFGYNGKSMRTGYEQLSPGKAFLAQYKNEHLIKGYYTSIRKIGSYVFRTYQQENNKYRMQIYKDRVLLGDVSVPECFRVLGKIGPYYYSEIVTYEDKEDLLIYKFTLE